MTNRKSVFFLQNFQALPKQPLQITKKQSVQGMAQTEMT